MINLPSVVVSVTDKNESDLCNWGWRLAAEQPGTAVRFVRGNKMRRVDPLFDELSAAFQFPHYFGENWAALADCLGDLEWLGAPHVVLIISRFPEVLVEEPIEMPAFGRAVRGAMERFNELRNKSEPSVDLFRIVLDCKVIDDPVLKQFLGEVAPAQMVGRI
ncbi:MAG TPA: barstar family protein [Bradyrhizobium sp.]|jgi:hypothetical protein